MPYNDRDLPRYPPEKIWVWGYDKGYDFDVKGETDNREYAIQQAARLPQGFYGMAQARRNPAYVKWLFDRMKELDQIMANFSPPNKYIKDAKLRDICTQLVKAYNALHVETGLFLANDKSTVSAEFRPGDRPDDETN